MDIRPFITRYAIGTAGERTCAPDATYYDPHEECLIVADTKKAAIDVPEAAIPWTGSRFTEARGDPTQDEPTDR